MHGDMQRFFLFSYLTFTNWLELKKSQRRQWKRVEKSSLFFQMEFVCFAVNWNFVFLHRLHSIKKVYFYRGRTSDGWKREKSKVSFKKHWSRVSHKKLNRWKFLIDCYKFILCKWVQIESLKFQFWENNSNLLLFHPPPISSSRSFFCWPSPWSTYCG